MVFLNMHFPFEDNLHKIQNKDLFSVLNLKGRVTEGGTGKGGSFFKSFVGQGKAGRQKSIWNSPIGDWSPGT